MEECDQSDLYFSEEFRMFIPCSARYFLDVGTSLSMKLATKRVKSFSNKFGMLMPCSETFSGSECTHFTESSQQRFFLR